MLINPAKLDSGEGIPFYPLSLTRNNKLVLFLKPKYRFGVLWVDPE